MKLYETSENEEDWFTCSKEGATRRKGGADWSCSKSPSCTCESGAQSTFPEQGHRWRRLGSDRIAHNDTMEPRQVTKKDMLKNTPIGFTQVAEVDSWMHWFVPWSLRPFIILCGILSSCAFEEFTWKHFSGQLWRRPMMSPVIPKGFFSRESLNPLISNKSRWIVLCPGFCCGRRYVQ